jgi:hypothetical protein
MLLLKKRNGRFARKERNVMTGELINYTVDSGLALNGTWGLVFGAACLLMGTIVALLLFAIVDTAARDRMLRRQHRELLYWQSRAMHAEDPGWRQ